ncbi:uncharacterized protein LOC132752089 [Ruditapes philippinarum]|uniref:uncharacterized protein LOC132752089 n=1 Tax=Ruditapes philippinarum TaxID=129788 RepID=UPI00295B8605|nr:uncharacterized protein LOC132752089 [Ruditapes philippinarum]
MVNEIKKTEDNVISTLGDIKRAVSDFTDMFADMKGNITDEMLKRSDEIKRREGSFNNLFEETKTNLTSDMGAKREELTHLQGSLKKLLRRQEQTSRVTWKLKEKNLLNFKTFLYSEKLERPTIAFHAHDVADLLLDKTNEIVIFTKSVINEGTGYDTSTGVFTAPVGGLYQFFVHTCVFKGNYAFIGIVLDGRIIAANKNYDNDYYTCSTVGAIVRVQSGEKVLVKSTSSSSNRRLHQYSLNVNTFSGVLVSN